ncbi:SART-1 protein [Athelia psychrophila]|uniref:SART-1 protein n=1 Tax=Athelia psychrophila TaxID=1759441 RepID=A0A166MAF4_9AGAM|nr:SART-1 protein [Fibularhizoctonia sp. CBS 109695]
MEESISLEETNKIRISLGLKPLVDDGKVGDDKEKQAEDNYAKRRQTEDQARDSKKITDRIAKVRNRQELNASLKGTTLGDANGDTDDALKWIKRAKKREKELAKKRQEELDSADKAIQDEYTDRDLVGLKVSHDFEEMGEGDARILTLKDSRILDNEEDELQNVEMAEDEKTKKNNDLKVKKRDYTGYDDDEFVDGNAGMKRSVLAKYDEDIEGTRETGFRLGSSTAATKAERGPQQEEGMVTVNKALLSIDYAKNMETADYLQEGDVGFKKPKTKKKRPSRRAPAEADIPVDGDATMDVDEKPIIPRARDLDSNFVDDDELQAALARSRRAKIHKPKKLSPEEIARKIAEERAKEAAAQVEENIKMEDDDAAGTEGQGLTFDDTSEFVRAIAYNPVAVKVEPVEAATTSSLGKQRAVSRDISMDRGEAIEEIEAGEVMVKDEEDEEDEGAILNAIEAAIRATEEEELAGIKQEVDDGVGTSAQQSFSTGMGATLNILRQQGILATPNSDQLEREKIQLQRDRWLADQRRKVAQRELDKQQSRGGNKDQAQREYENRQREQQEARQNLETFKNYKPDVNIVYYDEFGRSLTPKEAWKALSHKFHGKGSGKMKTEKRLQKIKEEQKKEAMISGDTPLSMNKAFQIRQEKAGQAHFVLSVGNRGAVPQAAEFFDSQPLSKSKAEKKSKKKEAAAKANAQPIDLTGFMPVPQSHALPSGASLASGFSPAMSTPDTGSPAPKVGFARISSAADATSSQGGTPVPTERSKVAFGFGTKRKAGEEAQGSPPPKRR